MVYILFGIVFLCGGMVGASLAIAILFKKKSGIIHITKDSDYDEPYIFLELNMPIHKLLMLKEVNFSVDSNWNPHK